MISSSLPPSSLPLSSLPPPTQTPTHVMFCMLQFAFRRAENHFPPLQKAGRSKSGEWWAGKTTRRRRRMIEQATPIQRTHHRLKPNNRFLFFFFFLPNFPLLKVLTCFAFCINFALVKIIFPIISPLTDPQKSGKRRRRKKDEDALHATAHCPTTVLHRIERERIKKSLSNTRRLLLSPRSPSRRNRQQ